MHEITEWLAQARAGDKRSLDRVFTVLHAELKRLAAARVRNPGDTLSPTVLVNELYLRFSGRERLDVTDRLHFLATAARAMRGLAVDHLRATQAQKRGGGATPVTLSVELALAGSGDAVDLIALDQALDRLDAIDPAQRELVELHCFAGLDFVEIAALREVNERTVRRGWARACAFLATQLSGSGEI
jgi:RNA polymerase sigma factor (TIGR02999 family)